MDTVNSPVRAGSPEALPDSPETIAFNERCDYYENRDMFDVRGGPCLSPLRLEGERDPFSELDKMLSWKGVNDEVLLVTGPDPDMSFCDEAVAKRDAVDAADAKTKARDTKKKKKLARLNDLEERAKEAAKEFEDAAESEESGSDEKEDAPVVEKEAEGEACSVTQEAAKEVGGAEAFGKAEARNVTDENPKGKERVVLKGKKDSGSPKMGKKTRKNDERSSAKKGRAVKKKPKEGENEKGVSKIGRETKISSANAEELKEKTDRDDAEDVENKGREADRPLQREGKLKKQKEREDGVVTEIASQLVAEIAMKKPKKRGGDELTKKVSLETERAVVKQEAGKKRKRQEDAEDAVNAKRENKKALEKEDSFKKRKEMENADAIETAKKLAARALAKEDAMAKKKEAETTKKTKNALDEGVDEVKSMNATRKRKRESAVALSGVPKSAKEKIEKVKLKRKEKEESKLFKSDTRKTKEKSANRRHAKKDTDDALKDNDEQNSKIVKGKDKDRQTSKHGELVTRISPPVGKQSKKQADLPKSDSYVVRSVASGRSSPPSKKEARVDGININLEEAESKNVALPENKKRRTDEDARNGRTESEQKTKAGSKNLRLASERKEKCLKAKANNESGAATLKADSGPVAEKNDNSKKDTDRKSGTGSEFLKHQKLLDALPGIQSIPRKPSSARVEVKVASKNETGKPNTEESRIFTKECKVDTGKSAKLEEISAAELKQLKAQSAATSTDGTTALAEPFEDGPGNARFGRGGKEQKIVPVVLPRRPTADEERKRLLVEEEEKRRIAAEKDRKRLSAAEEERKRLLTELKEKNRTLAEKEKERLSKKKERKRLSAEEERKRLSADGKGKRPTAEKEEKRPTAKEDEKRPTAEEEGTSPKVEEEKKGAEGGEFQGPRGKDSETNDRQCEKSPWNSGFERGSYDNGHGIPAYVERGRYGRNDYRGRHIPDNTNWDYRRDEWGNDTGHDLGRAQLSSRERRGDWDHGNRRGLEMNRHYDGGGDWNRDGEPFNGAKDRARESWGREEYRHGSAPEQGYDRHRSHYERNDYFRQDREGASKYQRPPSHDLAPAPPVLGQSAHTPSNSSNRLGRKQQRENHYYPVAENAAGPDGVAPCATSSMKGRTAAGHALKKHCSSALRGTLWKPKNLQDVDDARNLYRSTFEKAKMEYQRLLDENSKKPTLNMIVIAKASATGCYNLAMMSEKKWLIVRAKCDTEENAELKSLSKEAFDFYSYLSRNFCCKRIAEIKKEQFPEEHAWFLRLQSKTKLRLLEMNRLHNRDLKVEVAAAQQYLVEAVTRKEKVVIAPEMLKSLSSIVERDQQRLKLYEDTNGTGDSSEMPGFETLVEFLPFPPGS